MALEFGGRAWVGLEMPYRLSIAQPGKVSPHIRPQHGAAGEGIIPVPAGRAQAQRRAREAAASKRDCSRSATHLHPSGSGFLRQSKVKGWHFSALTLSHRQLPVPVPG